MGLPVLRSIGGSKPERNMAFVKFTRPDDSLVVVNSGEVVACAPAPKDGPLAGPLADGTRIAFRNGTHQDVKELLDEVQRRLNAAG
jgi:hypothetical protein